MDHGVAGTLKYGFGDAEKKRCGARLDYHAYHAPDWTIDADETGTTFTNDRTRHGMWVDAHSAAKF